MYDSLVNFIRKLYNTDEFIPLHEPRFIGNEKNYLNDCIDSTFVSSVGKYVDEFEAKIANYTGAKYAVATVNGTSALHISLLLANVGENDEVITQPLTFVATCNAISYCNAKPIFVDVEKETLGMCPESLLQFLEENTMQKDGLCVNKVSGKIIKACVPMHTFGHPCNIEMIAKICANFNIFLIEDAAESLGSFYKEKHTGTFGKVGVFSFNGNKIITSGGGGCIVTDDKELAEKAKYITTTAKISHQWEYKHDMIAYNYRLPNLNAALLVAQLESLTSFIADKREVASNYNEFFKSHDIEFFQEPENCVSNYWLNVILLKDRNERDKLLTLLNEKGIMSRPVWQLMNNLDMFNNCQCADLSNAKYLADRIVNIPSSARII